MSRYEYFSDEELSCKCGKCGRGSEHMNHTFMEKVIKLRRKLNFSMVVSSAYRCPEHNTKVSSTGETGPHTTGRAIDIQCNHMQALSIVEEARKHGFTGIGVKQKGVGRFVHLDDLGNGYPRPAFWSY